MATLPRAHGTRTRHAIIVSVTTTPLAMTARNVYRFIMTGHGEELPEGPQTHAKVSRASIDK